MKWVAKFLVTPLVLLLAALYVPGVVVDGLYTALIVAVILGLLNITVRPILLIFSLPITILTFGLFVFVLNGLLLWFVSTFVEGLAFSGFLTALLVALLISVANAIADALFD